MSNPSTLIRPPAIHLSLADVGAGRLAELGLMITGSGFNQRGDLVVEYAPRRELECGHPGVCLRANADGSQFCLACRRMEAPARRVRPVSAPAEEE
jgi:hypothetical protein